MVSCSYCVKKNLPCKLSSLNARCGNCVRNGIKECSPSVPPAPDFSKIDREVARLEALEVEAEVCDEQLFEQLRANRAREEQLAEQLRANRAKLVRLRRQKKFLKRREKDLFNKELETVEDLEQLEAMEQLQQEVSAVDPDFSALDWSTFLPDGVTGPVVSKSVLPLVLLFLPSD